MNFRKIYYYIGLHWPWFRRQYHKRTGGRWWWGIRGMIDDLD